jgi:hypothetical protein
MIHKILLPFAALALTTTGAMAAGGVSGGVSGGGVSGVSGISGGLGIDFAASNVPGANSEMGGGFASAIEDAFNGQKKKKKQ